MRYRLIFVAAAVLLASCSGTSAETTTTSATYPSPTHVEGCGDVSYIIPSSSDAIVEMGRVSTFVKDQEPSIAGTEYNATLMQITRQGGYDLITVVFDNSLGTVLFAQDPDNTLHFGWRGVADSESEIRDSLQEQFPDFPVDIINCQDLSYFVPSVQTDG